VPNTYSAAPTSVGQGRLLVDGKIPARVAMLVMISRWGRCTHQLPPAIIGELVGMAAEQARNLGVDRLRQKRSRRCAKPRSADQQKFLAAIGGKH
jgi:hypothetical protein